MGTSFPTTPRSAFADWCTLHAPIFLANTEDIGLTADQATQFNTLVNAMNTALSAQLAAKEAAKSATVTANAAFNDTRSLAGDLVKAIRSYAELSGKPTEVYTMAQIPPPATPSPLPPPGMPTEMKVELDSNTGALILRWKASNPSGNTGYVISRKLPGETAWTIVGISGKKEFIDDTFVAGPDYVQYQVQGLRGGVGGPVSPIFTVTFGIAPGGQMVAKVTSAKIESVTPRGTSLPVKSSAHGNGDGNGETRKTSTSRVGS